MQVTKRIYRLPEVLIMYGASKASIYRWIAQGRFPQPIKLGERAVGWTAESLRKYDESLSPVGV